MLPKIVSSLTSVGRDNGPVVKGLFQVSLKHPWVALAKDAPFDIEVMTVPGSRNDSVHRDLTIRSVLSLSAVFSVLSESTTWTECELPPPPSAEAEVRSGLRLTPLPPLPPFALMKRSSVLVGRNAVQVWHASSDFELLDSHTVQTHVFVVASRLFFFSGGRTVREHGETVEEVMGASRGASVVARGAVGGAGIQQPSF